MKDSNIVVRELPIGKVLYVRGMHGTPLTGPLPWEKAK